MPSDTRCNQVFALFEQIQLLRSPAVLPHKQTHLLTWAAAALTSFPERLRSPPLARADPGAPGGKANAVMDNEVTGAAPLHQCIIRHRFQRGRRIGLWAEAGDAPPDMA